MGGGVFTRSDLPRGGFGLPDCLSFIHTLAPAKMLNPSKDAASARVLASTPPKELLLVSGCSRVRAVSPAYVAIATLPNLNPSPTFCTWVCTTAV